MPDRDEPRPVMRTNENLIGRGVGGVAKPLPSQPHDPGEPPLTMQFPGTAPTLRLQLWECHQRIAKMEAENERLRIAIQRALDDEESGDGWGPDNTVCAYLRCALDPTPERVRLLAEFDEANRRAGSMPTETKEE